MKLGRLIAHYGSTVASIQPWQDDERIWTAMLSCTNGETHTEVSLSTRELRAFAASALDLADEIDGYNQPEEATNGVE